MEKNVIPAGSQPIGALATEDIMEGRFVLMTSHTWDENFGSLTDLPGVKLPDNATEAGNARYVISWPAPNRQVSVGNPWYVDAPSFDYALRGGWDQGVNLPMTVTVRVTYPGNQESVVIPSGYKALLLSEGAIVTIPSGQFVYSADVETPGARLEVLNAADDTAAEAGKLSYNASGSIAEVVEFNSADASLIVRIIA